MAKTKGDTGILFVRDVDRLLLNQVRAIAVLLGVSMRDVVVDALRSYLKAHAPWGRKEEE